MDTLITKLTEIVNALDNLGGGNVNIDCGCPGGIDPPGTPGIEGEDPPPGFTPTADLPGTEPYQTRKCKVANVIHQFVKDAIAAIIASPADEIVGGLIGAGLGLAAAYILSIFAVLTFGWVVLIIGAALVIVEAILSSAFDFADLQTRLGAADSDYVCALSGAIDTDDAADRYITVLENQGAGIAQTGFIRAVFLLPDLLNQLFFDPDPGPRAVALQTAVDAWEGGVDCATCSCNEFVLLLGSYNSETGVLSSQANGGAHKIAIMFNSTIWAYDWLTTKEYNCGPMAIPTFGSITGGAPISSFAFEVVGDEVTDLYVSSSTMWANPGQHGRSFWIVRNAAFTVPLIGFTNYGG
jgi:hypothetical protein